MNRTTRMLVVIALTVAVGAVVANELKNSLASPARLEEGVGPGTEVKTKRQQEYLFRGDMTAELGLGCTIGFPGNWVMRALVDHWVPVELQAFTVE